MQHSKPLRDLIEDYVVYWEEKPDDPTYHEKVLAIIEGVSDFDAMSTVRQLRELKCDIKTKRDSREFRQRERLEKFQRLLSDE